MQLTFHLENAILIRYDLFLFKRCHTTEYMSALLLKNKIKKDLTKHVYNFISIPHKTGFKIIQIS